MKHLDKGHRLDYYDFFGTSGYIGKYEELVASSLVCAKHDCEKYEAMELKAYFSGIQPVIIEHLGNAQSEIVAAIAWFTDGEIFDVLCNRARACVKISVAMLGDEINKGPSGLNFHKLTNLGARVVFLPPGSRTAPIMHHKFCVIDGATVITGSYNWSKKARTNDENITVVTNSIEFAGQYLEAFNDLLARAGQPSTTSFPADKETVRRRLELIRSLILLGEQDELAPHVRKLRPVADKLKLGPLITGLDQGQYKAALEMIDDHLRKVTALVVADDAEISRLRFDLMVLEVRLESLTDEKAELERCLITFNRRHSEALGDLIQRVLRARADLARLAAEQHQDATAREEAQTEAQEAEDAYTEYARQHEELKKEEPLPVLDKEAEQELKSLYRKACSLCHPDKFPDEQKEAAHGAFTALQEAYRRNDLDQVREIHATLSAGGLPTARSATLRLVDTLKAAVAELEYKIAGLLGELAELKESDACSLMESAGATEAEWTEFFERQREALNEELVKLVSEILQYQDMDEDISV